MTPNELRTARKELGLSQSELASRLGMRGADARRSIRAYETGEREIPGPVALVIRYALEHGWLADTA